MTYFAKHTGADEKPLPKEKKPKGFIKRTAIKKKFKKSGHVKLYLDYFKYENFFCCEIPKCTRPGVDIHHIDCRGMGGTKKEDKIENLMGLCREHHNEYGDKKQWTEQLKIWHKKFTQHIILND